MASSYLQSAIDDGVDIEARLPNRNWTESQVGRGMGGPSDKVTTTTWNAQSCRDNAHNLRLSEDPNCGFHSPDSDFYQSPQRKAQSTRTRTHPVVTNVTMEDLRAQINHAQRFLNVKFVVKEEKDDNKLLIRAPPPPPTFLISGEGGKEIIVDGKEPPIDAKSPGQRLLTLSESPKASHGEIFIDPPWPSYEHAKKLDNLSVKSLMKPQSPATSAKSVSPKQLAGVNKFETIAMVTSSSDSQSKPEKASPKGTTIAEFNGHKDAIPSSNLKQNEKKREPHKARKPVGETQVRAATPKVDMPNPPPNSVPGNKKGVGPMTLEKKAKCAQKTNGVAGQDGKNETGLRPAWDKVHVPNHATSSKGTDMKVKSGVMMTGGLADAAPLSSVKDAGKGETSGTPGWPGNDWGRCSGEAAWSWSATNRDAVPGATWDKNEGVDEKASLLWDWDKNDTRDPTDGDQSRKNIVDDAPWSDTNKRIKPAGFKFGKECQGSGNDEEEFAPTKDTQNDTASARNENEEEDYWTGFISVRSKKKKKGKRRVTPVHVERKGTTLVKVLSTPVVEAAKEELLSTEKAAAGWSFVWLSEKERRKARKAGKLAEPGPEAPQKLKTKENDSTSEPSKESGPPTMEPQPVIKAPRSDRVDDWRPRLSKREKRRLKKAGKLGGGTPLPSKGPEPKDEPKEDKRGEPNEEPKATAETPTEDGMNNWGLGLSKRATKKLRKAGKFASPNPVPKLEPLKEPDAQKDGRKDKDEIWAIATSKPEKGAKNETHYRTLPPNTKPKQSLSTLDASKEQSIFLWKSKGSNTWEGTSQKSKAFNDGSTQSGKETWNTALTEKESTHSTGEKSKADDNTRVTANGVAESVTDWAKERKEERKESNGPWSSFNHSFGSFDGRSEPTVKSRIVWPAIEISDRGSNASESASKQSTSTVKPWGVRETQQQNNALPRIAGRKEETPIKTVENINDQAGRGSKPAKLGSPFQTKTFPSNTTVLPRDNDNKAMNDGEEEENAAEQTRAATSPGLAWLYPDKGPSGAWDESWDESWDIDNDETIKSSESASNTRSRDIARERTPRAQDRKSPISQTTVGTKFGAQKLDNHLLSPSWLVEATSNPMGNTSGNTRASQAGGSRAGVNTIGGGEPDKQVCILAHAKLATIISKQEQAKSPCGSAPTNYQPPSVESASTSSEGMPTPKKQEEKGGMKVSWKTGWGRW